MAYKMKKDLADKSNYGSKRSLAKIKYIVIHYTSNDGDTDEANANYYNGKNRKASAHYFVDDDSVTQSVPDNYVAWSVGGSKYSNCKTTGGGSLHGKCTNANSLSIEICDDVRDGKVYPSDATIANVLELTKKLMKKYGIPTSRVVRHFDVTGKSCPAYWCGTASKNKKWKTEFWDKLSETPAKKEPTKKEEPKKETFKSYKVKITTKTLNVRAGAGAKYKVATTVKKNEVYTIVEEKMNGSTKWLKLKSGTGWISANYTKKV